MPNSTISSNILLIILFLNSVSSKLPEFKSKHPQSTFIPLTRACDKINRNHNNKAIDIKDAPFMFKLKIKHIPITNSSIGTNKANKLFKNTGVTW